MKKQIILSAVVIAAGLFSACSDAFDMQQNGGRAQEAQAPAQFLRVSTDVEDLQKPTTRVGYDRQTEDGQQKLKFRWAIGDTLRVWTMFRDGATTRVAKSALATIKRQNSNGTYHLTYEVEVPQGITLSENVEITGACGVDSVLADGKATITWSKDTMSTDVSKNDYRLPMYFKPAKLKHNADDTWSASVYFQMYGALINVKLTSELYDPFEPRQMVFNTRAFTTEGTMDLNTITATSAPAWAATAAQLNFQQRLVLMKGGVVASRGYAGQGVDDLQQGAFWVWVMPTEGVGQQTMTVKVQDDAYAETVNTGRSEPIVKQFNVPQLQQDRFYDITIPLTSDLIITERYTGGAQGSMMWWEIYNPTTQPIKLKDYCFVHRDFESSPAKYYAVQLGKDMKFSGRANYEAVEIENNTNYSQLTGDLYLDPGYVIIYAGTTATIIDQIRDSQEKRKVAYIFNFYSGRTTLSGTGFSAYAFKGTGKDAWWISKGLPIESTGLPKVDDPALLESTIVDAFGRQLDANGNYVQSQFNDVTYARRPDRNFPRKWWIVEEKDNTSDWVYRTQSVTDMGYRYGVFSLVTDRPPRNLSETNTFAQNPRYYNTDTYHWQFLNFGRVQIDKDYLPPYYWNYYWAH